MSKDEITKLNKLTPDDLPIIICALSGRPTPKKEAVFQYGRWVRKEFEDKARHLIQPKED